MVIRFDTDVLSLGHISCSDKFNHGYDFSLLTYASFPVPSFCVRLLNYSLTGLGLHIRACCDIACVVCFDNEAQHQKPSFRQRKITTTLVQQNEEY